MEVVVERGTKAIVPASSIHQTSPLCRRHDHASARGHADLVVPSTCQLNDQNKRKIERDDSASGDREFWASSG